LAGAVKIHADARLYAGLFDAGETASMALDPQRKAYVHLVKGRLSVNGQALEAGDAALISQASLLAFAEADQAEALVFDLHA
jgi:redox-sensitive bicupin YhaK (pirin superfamily)